MKRRNYLFRFAMTLLLLLISMTSMAYTPIQSQSGSESDPIIFTGSSEYSPFENTNGLLITICGARKISLQEVGLYHCVIFYLEGRLIEQGNKTSHEGNVSRLTDFWKIQKSRLGGQKSIVEGLLTIKYNLDNKSISVDSKEYKIADGNLFVVHWDEKGGIRVMQVSATLDECAGSEDILTFYKKVLPDKAIKKLKVM